MTKTSEMLEDTWDSKTSVSDFIVGIVVGSVDLSTRLLGGGPGSESLCDDTTDNRNVVADTPDEDDDDNESNHGSRTIFEIDTWKYH